MFLLFCNTIGQPIRDQFGGVWSVALGKWLCSPVGNDGKLDGRLECKNDDVTIGPLSSKSKIEVYHVIIRNSFLEFVLPVVTYRRNWKKLEYMDLLHQVAFHHLLLLLVLRLYPVRDFDQMDSLLVVEMLGRHFQITTYHESEFQLEFYQPVEQRTAVQSLEVIQHGLQVNVKEDDQIYLAERGTDILII